MWMISGRLLVFGRRSSANAPARFSRCGASLRQPGCGCAAISFPAFRSASPSLHAGLTYNRVRRWVFIVCFGECEWDSDNQFRLSIAGGVAISALIFWLAFWHPKIANGLVAALVMFRLIVSRYRLWPQYVMSRRRGRSREQRQVEMIMLLILAVAIAAGIASVYGQ